MVKYGHTLPWSILRLLVAAVTGKHLAKFPAEWILGSYSSLMCEGMSLSLSCTFVPFTHEQVEACYFPRFPEVGGTLRRPGTTACPVSVSLCPCVPVQPRVPSLFPCCSPSHLSVAQQTWESLALLKSICVFHPRPRSSLLSSDLPQPLRTSHFSNNSKAKQTDSTFALLGRGRQTLKTLSSEKRWNA